VGHSAVTLTKPFVLNFPELPKIEADLNATSSDARNIAQEKKIPLITKREDLRGSDDDDRDTADAVIEGVQLKDQNIEETESSRDPRSPRNHLVAVGSYLRRKKSSFDESVTSYVLMALIILVVITAFVVLFAKRGGSKKE